MSDDQRSTGLRDHDRIILPMKPMSLSTGPRRLE